MHQLHMKNMNNYASSRISSKFNNMNNKIGKQKVYQNPMSTGLKEQ
jgi:hypothetical protein